MNVSIDFSNDLSYLLSKHCSDTRCAKQEKQFRVQSDNKFPFDSRE